MSSSHASWWKRKILYHIPNLFKKCTEDNHHWFWHRWCWCRDDVDLHDMKRNVLYTKARCGLDDNCWRLKNHDGECTRKMEPSGAAYKLAEQLEESDAESVTIYLDKDGDPFFTSILMPMIVTDAFRERGEPESA